MLSNKPDDATQVIVSTLFAGAPFADVVGQRPKSRTNPTRRSRSSWRNAMGVPPQYCAFVGDSGIDMATGRAAGMMTVGVTWGFRDRAELRAHGADTLIDRPDQLVALLG